MQAPPLGALAGRTAVLATMHHKERVIAPLLGRFLGLKVQVPQGFDSDRFGTFSREIARTGSALEAARAKIAAGFALMPEANVGLASEGSFGPHPELPFVSMGLELVLLVDRDSGLELAGWHGAPAPDAPDRARQPRPGARLAQPLPGLRPARLRPRRAGARAALRLVPGPDRAGTRPSPAMPLLRPRSDAPGTADAGRPRPLRPLQSLTAIAACSHSQSSPATAREARACTITRSAPRRPPALAARWPGCRLLPASCLRGDSCDLRGSPAGGILPAGHPVSSIGVRPWV